MAVVDNQLVLVDPNDPDASRPYQGLHAVSPILTGLAAPFVALLFVAPRGFANLGIIAPAILLLVMLATGIIFLHGVFTAGRIAALTFNPGKRTVDIIQTGLFTRRVTSLPFNEVAGLRSASQYDRDGYRYATTELVLRNGEALVVPMQPTPAELEAVRGMLARQ